LAKEPLGSLLKKVASAKKRERKICKEARGGWVRHGKDTLQFLRRGNKSFQSEKAGKRKAPVEKRTRGPEMAFLETGGIQGEKPHRGGGGVWQRILKKGGVESDLNKGCCGRRVML